MASPSTPTFPTLRQTDFLPNRFSGDTIDRDRCTAHILTFQDYLDAHDYDASDAAQLHTIIKIFKRSLQGQARLWIDGKAFDSFDALKSAFIGRLSGTKSKYAHVIIIKIIAKSKASQVPPVIPSSTSRGAHILAMYSFSTRYR